MAYAEEEYQHRVDADCVVPGRTVATALTNGSVLRYDSIHVKKEGIRVLHRSSGVQRHTYDSITRVKPDLLDDGIGHTFVSGPSLRIQGICKN